ncbi:MAG: hypothetical protein CMM76_06805 [Rhodospirillaceae bacterium]|nr:hypothetical protein [Rhodospirillaceae bacterium]
MTLEGLQQAIETHQNGNLETARKQYEAILQKDIHNSDALNLLGLIHFQQKDYEQGLIYIEKAVRLRPKAPEYHNNLGMVLNSLGRVEEAVVAYLDALELAPTYADVFYNLGILENNRHNYQIAVEYFQTCLNCAPTNRNVRNGMAIALIRLDKLHKATKQIEKQLGQYPQDVDALNNLSVVKVLSKDNYNARKTLEIALEIDSQHVTSRLNRAQLILLDGNLRDGFAEHEWRLKSPDYEQKFEIPRWTGEAQPDSTIVLWGEQGLGDALQFIRYAPMVKQRIGKLVVSCRPPLQKLFATIPAVDEVISSTASSTAHAHLPIMSLPYIFQTTANSIPAEVPYIPVPAPLTLPGDKSALKVGIVWAGNPKHPRDSRRSRSLDEFAPLGSSPKVDFFSLQMGKAKEQRPPESLKLIDLTHHIEDFYDTARIVAALDLLITVDTSIAHLGGALNKPVWLIIDEIPDWRWQLKRKDSPWYPTLQLFRSKGDYGLLFKEMAQALFGLNNRRT